MRNVPPQKFKGVFWSCVSKAISHTICTMFLWQRIGLVLALTAVAGCAKEKVSIGRTDPDLEIQKCIHLSGKKLYEEAVECLEIFKSRFPQTQLGQEAELKIADTYFRQGEFLLAAETYQVFISLYPNHPKVDYALYRKGLSYFEKSPKAIDRDQQYLDKAVGELESFVRIFPTSPYYDLGKKALADAENRLAERIFYVGRFYYRTDEYQSAAARMEELIQKYPNSTKTPHALFFLTESRLALGDSEAARVAVSMLIEIFPNDDWTKKAQDSYFKTIGAK